ncbi:MAG: adenylate/guanylate cyclase domain-containing protein [Pseudomonadota bacterium]|nr:adenylate/guanylate cyclase domain-containing protein [Pseudomonadota bacterium]
MTETGAAEHAEARPKQLLTALRQDIGSPQGLKKLPERVVRAIVRQEDASEVLIKIIQLAIVSLFGFLYLISPKTDAGTAFSPVPYVLGGYLVFTLLGLMWAMYRRMPDWAVYLSIVLDVVLLMSLIFSFHIQYQQPASFFLKAPTLLYVFIFIALRGLRFQPRFVIASGVASALGWLAMVIYVIRVDPSDSMVTRNYVQYMTSNSILLGAEFDKIITILTVTFVLALVLKRGRRLLVEAVAESTAARDLSRFFDEGVATQIRGAAREIAAGEGVKRIAAILNTDIRGFTPLATGMEPGDVIKLLADYQSRIVPVIQKNGGTIDKFLGDGIMATFGATYESDSFAADALTTADEIVAVAEAWEAERRAAGAKPIAVNVSVASGPLVFGAVGGQNRLEYTVIGSAVNLAAKLEKHNKALKARAVTTGETFDLGITQGYSASGKPERVKTDVQGVTGSQEVVVLHY